MLVPVGSLGGLLGLYSSIVGSSWWKGARFSRPQTSSETSDGATFWQMCVTEPATEMWAE